MLQRNSDLPYVIPDEPQTRPAEGWQYPTVDLREMGRILRRRYKMALLPALGLLGLAVIYLLLATTLYTATSTVLVDPRRANVVESNQSVLSNFGTDDATIERRTMRNSSQSPGSSIRSSGCSAAAGRATARAPKTRRERDRWRSCRSG